MRLPTELHGHPVLDNAVRAASLRKISIFQNGNASVVFLEHEIADHVGCG